VKRQIIKTRPQRPYAIARIVFVVVIAIVVLTVAWALWKRSRQDFDFALRNMRTPPTLTFATFATLANDEHLY
jgi:hypothetical protein